MASESLIPDECPNRKLPARRAVDGGERKIDEVVARLKVHIRLQIENVVAIGNDLEILKEIAESRRFLAEIEKLGLQPRTAQMYMRIAQYIGDKCEMLSHLRLPLTTLYLLARRSTPEVVRAEIFRKLDAGEPLTRSQIEDAVKTTKKTSLGNPTADPPPNGGPGARSLENSGSSASTPLPANREAAQEAVRLLEQVLGEDEFGRFRQLYVEGRVFFEEELESTKPVG
jgi:hypothetical protein